MTGKIFVYYDIIRQTLQGQLMSYTDCTGMPLVSTTKLIS